MNGAYLIDEKFAEWTLGRDPVQARINIFYQIRDIPYAVIPELNNLQGYADILIEGKGACMPKHLLLGNMFCKLGLQVLYTVVPFRWDKAEIDYPDNLFKLARSLPVSYHFACKVEIDNDYIPVDATLDLAMKKIGLPVNETWDGFTAPVSPVIPCGPEEVYQPAEIFQEAETTPAGEILHFYQELNQWLQTIRSS